jgi:hypothetical protein
MTAITEAESAFAAATAARERARLAVLQATADRTLAYRALDKDDPPEHQAQIRRDASRVVEERERDYQLASWAYEDAERALIASRG